MRRSLPGLSYVYRRRINWTRDEWILAYEACPKVNQSYGPDAPFVRELADLLGRTPAAISRAFGNLWAAQTNGRHGLRNRSHLADEVVAEYRSDPKRLRKDALALRSERIPVVSTPRLELISSADGAPLPADVVEMSALQAGLPREFYFVTIRPGSTIIDVGILLDGLVAGTTGWLAVTHTIQLIRDYLRSSKASDSPAIEFVNRSWRDVEGGRQREVEERVVRVFLPEARVRRLSEDALTRLTGFFSFLKGIRREPRARAPQTRLEFAGARVGRPLSRGSLERLLRVDLSRVPDEVLKQLSDVVKAARSTEFESALRKVRKTAKRRRLQAPKG